MEIYLDPEISGYFVVFFSHLVEDGNPIEPFMFFWVNIGEATLICISCYLDSVSLWTQIGSKIDLVPEIRGTTTLFACVL